MKYGEIKKLYYSISEVSRLVGEEQYVLRYWETEFDVLRPKKNRAGNRIYTQKDVDIIKAIKKLLRDKRYTVQGAKEVVSKLSFDNSEFLAELEAQKEAEPSQESANETPVSNNSEQITFSRQELLEMQTTLRAVLQLLS